MSRERGLQNDGWVGTKRAHAASLGSERTQPQAKPSKHGGHARSTYVYTYARTVRRKRTNAYFSSAAAYNAPLDMSGAATTLAGTRASAF